MTAVDDEGKEKEPGDGSAVTAEVSPLSVVTSLYVTCRARWDYFVTTIDSFRRSAVLPPGTVHSVLDDRSPSHGAEIAPFCASRGLRYLGRSDEKTRAGFCDVLLGLAEGVGTPYVLYLEPDHYFFRRADFVTPALRMFDVLPELSQVYLRAPLVYRSFVRTARDVLTTHDGTRLSPVRVGGSDTGWVGRGVKHETFSLMPSLFRTRRLGEALRDTGLLGRACGPAEVEAAAAEAWAGRALVGYVNGAAFCYHIGAEGKTGPGGFLPLRDEIYERIWSVPHR